MVNLPNFRKVLGEVKQADAVPPVPSQEKQAEAEEPVRSKVEEEVAEKAEELEQGKKLYRWTKVDISDEGNRESVNAMIGEEDVFQGEALLDATCFESLYSGCCRSSVPGNLAVLVAYHAVIHFPHARRPCGRSYDRWGFGLTYARSAVRPLAPPYLRPTSFPRRVDHVGGPVVRGREDMAGRSSFALSIMFQPVRI
ncbi:hypothetical protein BHE74_00037693 [Ensete ventricosum]|nr:hypothetical protein BHE74_00037693 [Ensete ventricosum]